MSNYCPHCGARIDGTTETEKFYRRKNRSQTFGVLAAVVIITAIAIAAGG